MPKLTNRVRIFIVFGIIAMSVVGAIVLKEPNVLMAGITGLVGALNGDSDSQ